MQSKSNFERDTQVIIENIEKEIMYDLLHCANETFAMGWLDFWRCILVFSHDL